MRGRAPRAALLALALTLGLAAPSLAATASQSTAETLTVNSTVTLTGLPASTAYGTGVAGDTRSSSTFSLVASTNNALGVKVVWAAADMTRTGAPADTIASTNRSLLVASQTGGAFMNGWATIPAAPQAYAGPAGSDKVVANRSTAGTLTLSGVRLDVAIPADAVPGAYTGTTTFKAIEN